MLENGDYWLKNGIVGWKSPVLSKKARKVSDFDENLVKTVQNMHLQMAYARGVGLAAPQMGINTQIFTYRYKEDAGEFINPILTVLEASEIVDDESCLSSPNVEIKVPRASKIRLVGQDVTGAEVSRVASGYLARVFQHEYDHLQGRCIADRLPREARRRLQKALREED